jgi:hypothetical protein
MYLASTKEIFMAMEKIKLFVIQKLEVQQMIVLSEMFKEGRHFLENFELFSNFISNMNRVAIGEFLEGHIGVELAKLFFVTFKTKNCNTC